MREPLQPERKTITMKKSILGEHETLRSAAIPLGAAALEDSPFSLLSDAAGAAGTCVPSARAAS